ncbi:hypothetical protein AN403_6149 [Pseudomonas fluorescens]|uniref:Uncharacterized protein n=1 Tax=Pseudomonas fluorescens TaxID=294 RepID=A0A0P8XX14_PSEFL|nr:hypothetical protein [Pseudomonas fluorescens]KPU61983.1 hypothetical protein AN403_6149 [Pseudomonas fluorescens]
MAVDIVSEELTVFKAATTRMRWLINTALLISVMIILRMYLANFSLQNQQLQDIYYNRFVLQITTYRECQGTIFNALMKLPDKSYDEREKLKNDIVNKDAACSDISSKIRSLLLSTPMIEIIRNYSRLERELTTNENTIYDEKLPSRSIPLLNINVPANDFVNVMAVVSTFIVFGIWMSLRGIHAALLSLCLHGDLDVVRVAQLNTVFLTYSEAGGNTFAKRVRALSMWLPFLSIFTATLIGYWPILQRKIEGTENYIGLDSYAGSDLVITVFLALSIFVSSVHFFAALKCYKVIN